jgi:hypothetical protein
MRAMNLLGLYLGAEEELMPASEQNESGYWENMSIYRINEQLLELFGGSWYRPPALPHAWPDDPQVEQLRERASHVVDELRASGRHWGFKDPRTVVTLPFWRRVIGVMDYVICVRRPEAFIRSVQALPLPEAEPHATAKLWLDMNIAALRQTVGERRAFVFYDEWFEDPRKVAWRLAAFIHGDASEVAPDSVDAVDAFVDRTLRRADATVGAPLPAASELEAVYAHLRRIAVHNSENDDARYREVRAAEDLADVYRFQHALEENALVGSTRAIAGGRLPADRLG